jgi:hypothetical protein
VIGWLGGVSLTFGTAAHPAKRPQTTRAIDVRIMVFLVTKPFEAMLLDTGPVPSLSDQPQKSSVV